MGSYDGFAEAYFSEGYGEPHIKHFAKSFAYELTTWTASIGGTGQLLKGLIGDNPSIPDDARKLIDDLGKYTDELIDLRNALKGIYKEE